MCAKYLPRILGQEKVHCVLAEWNDVPFGFLQRYRNDDHREWAEHIGTEDGRSVDLFIGDASYLGRGLGWRMLAAFTASDGPYYISHDVKNAAAIQCSRRAGFQDLRWLFVEDDPVLLLKRSQAEFPLESANATEP